MKVSKESIQEFTSQKNIAIAGVSRNPKKFGNYVFKELKKKEYNVYPVNPNLDVFEDVQCFHTLSELPPEVTALHVNTSPENTPELLRQAHERGIHNVWIQQGATNPEALAFGLENNMNVISGKCIMMFAEPVTSVHGFHRFIMRILGKIPNG